MRRVLEAGRFVHGGDMLVELQREPVVSIHDDFARVHREMGFPEEKLYKYLETGELELSCQMELTKRQNYLDERIKSWFEVFNSAYHETRRSSGHLLSHERYSQRKNYHLQQKEGLVNVSPLEMDSYACYLNDKLMSYYVKATITGVLSDKDSPLAGMMMDYWKSQGLCLMNNVIIDERPNRMLFVEGSIKTEAAKMLISECFREYEEHALDVMPMSFSFLCDQHPELKEGYILRLKKTFPVQIIRETESHEF